MPGRPEARFGQPCTAAFSLRLNLPETGNDNNPLSPGSSHQGPETGQPQAAAGQPILQWFPLPIPQIHRPLWGREGSKSNKEKKKPKLCAVHTISFEDPFLYLLKSLIKVCVLGFSQQNESLQLP